MSPAQSVPVQDASPCYTFREIIDADHLSINRLAGKIRKLLASITSASSLVELNSLLLEITWRLVRHDFSEDVVMRPAFADVFGERGVEMGERDRRDHEGGRERLLGVLVEVEGVARESDMERRRERFEIVVEMVREIFDELGEHMRVESGEFLPWFESVIGRDVSGRLAREYAGTLVVTPELTRRVSDDEEVQERKVVFRGGVEEYVHTPMDQLRQLYTTILEETADEGGKAWFDEVTQRELEKIQGSKKRKHEKEVDSGEPNKQKDTKLKSKIPTNALGLPISWPEFRKAKM